VSAEGQPVRLGALEQQVMDVLWDHGPHAVREIIDRLPAQPAYTTIATVLGNLERKRLVTSARMGRSVRYWPRRSREEHAAEAMRHALASGGDRAASMLAFVETMTPDDLRLLRDYLEERGERS